MALPLVCAGRAAADVSATLVAAWHDTTAATTGVLNPVPGLPSATLAAAAANGITVTWNNPTAANGLGSGLQGISVANGSPAIGANGNVTFYGMMGLASYTTFDPITFLPITNYLTGNAVLVSASVPTNFTNNQALFSAPAATGYAFNSISIIARDGSTSSPTTSTGATDNLLGGSTAAPVTGIPAGSALNGTGSVANGNTKGLGTGYSMAPNGTMLFSSLVSPVSGPSTGTGNVTGTSLGATYFTGTRTGFAGSSSITNTGAAGGVNGGVFALTAAVNSSSLGSVTNSGQYPFVGTLTNNASATPAIDTTNNGGLWLGSSSGSTLIFQKGGAATGAVTGTGLGSPAFSSPTISNVRINAYGNTIISDTLSTSATTPTGFVGAYAPANSNQTGSLWYGTSSGSTQLIGQAGTPVPASAGLPSGVNYATSAAFSLNQQSFNNANQTTFFAKLNASSAANFPSAAGTVTSGTNDQVIMGWSASTGNTTTLFRTGVTPVPVSASITGATTFSDLGSVNNGIRLNNQGHYTFTGSLTHDAGGNIISGVAGTSRGNDQALFLGNVNSPGNATLIARSGDPAPGLPGTYLGSLLLASAINYNDVIFIQDLVVDAVGNQLKIGIFSITDWFAWTPQTGLSLVVQGGNTSYLGANYPLNANPISFNATSNGDGGSMGLNDAGFLTFNASSSTAAAYADQNTGVMVTQIPAPGASVLGLVGFVLIGRRRR